MGLGLYLAIGTVISCMFSLFRQESLGELVQRLIFILAINAVVWYLFFGGN